MYVKGGGWLRSHNWKVEEFFKVFPFPLARIIQLPNVHLKEKHVYKNTHPFYKVGPLLVINGVITPINGLING